MAKVIARTCENYTASQPVAHARQGVHQQLVRSLRGGRGAHLDPDRDSVHRDAALLL